MKTYLHINVPDNSRSWHLLKLLMRKIDREKHRQVRKEN